MAKINKEKMTKVSKEKDKEVAKNIKEGKGYTGLNLPETDTKKKEQEKASSESSKNRDIEKELDEEKVTAKSIIELITIVIAVIIILIFFPHTVVWNIVLLLLMLSLLITVHEFGHFIAAKKFGVHVYEFAIGMGPKVLSFKRKGDPTRYSLRALPIGGYNQLAGETGEDDSKLSKDKFMCNKPKWQRVIILCAGVTMNFILAIILLFVMACIWGSANQESVIAAIVPGSGAEEAGLVVGDHIIKMNGHRASAYDSLQIDSLLSDANKEGTNTYLVEHEDGTRETYEIKMSTYLTNTKTGKIVEKITEERTEEIIAKENNLEEGDYKVSTIAGFSFDTKLKKGFWRSVKYAFVKFWYTILIMLSTIWYLITGKLGLDALSGPVGMYTVIDTATNVGSLSGGLYNYIFLTAYISINLGVMNILPFPAFDGGQLMFVLYEKITGKKGNPNVEAYINLIGFILIFALMIFITFKDVLKIIG